MPEQQNENGQIITKDELLLGAWTPVRNEVWSSSILSQGAKLCYIAICSHIWKKHEKEAWPGQNRLAKLIGVSDRSIRAYLTELKDVKLITIERKGLNMTNNYYICKPQIDVLKPLWDADRKQASSQERIPDSTSGRNQASDKEEAVKEETINNNQSSVSSKVNSLGTTKKDDDDSEEENFESDFKTINNTGPQQKTNNKANKVQNQTPPKEIGNEYFLTIEQHLDKNNINVPLTFKNFAIVKKMYESDVPVELVLKTITEVTNNAKGKKIVSFKYFEGAIWENFNRKKATQKTIRMTEELLKRRRLARGVK